MTLLLALLLIAAPLRYEPAAPTVGDPITIEFPSDWTSVALAPSDDYEIVGSGEGQAVIRSFRPGTFTLRGTAMTPVGTVPLETVEIRVFSVIPQGDAMQPAPLRPLVSPASNRTAWWAIGGAAAVALLAWALLPLLAHRRLAPLAAPAAAADPLGDLRRAVEQASRLPTPELQSIALSDAVREFLGRRSPVYPRSLTTRELLSTLESAGVDAKIVGDLAALLSAGDASKFSPWGVGEFDVATGAHHALEAAEVERESRP